MAVNNNLTDFLTNIAKKIRKISGTNGAINPQDFTNRMDSFEMIPTETITLDRQGKHSVLGYAEAEVALPTYTLTSGHIDFSSTDSATHHTIGATFKIPGTGYYTEGQGASNSISLPIYTLDPPSISYLNASTLRVSTSTIRPNGDTTSQHGYIKRGSSSKDYTLVAPDKPTISYNTTSHKFQVSQNITNHLIKTGNNSWGFNVTDITNFPYANLTTPDYEYVESTGTIKVASKATGTGYLSKAREDQPHSFTLSKHTFPATKTLAPTGAIVSGTIDLEAGYYSAGSIKCSGEVSKTFLGKPTLWIPSQTNRVLQIKKPRHQEGFVLKQENDEYENTEVYTRVLPEFETISSGNVTTVTMELTHSGYYRRSDRQSISINTGGGSIPTCSLTFSGDPRTVTCTQCIAGNIEIKSHNVGGPQSTITNVIPGTYVYVRNYMPPSISRQPGFSVTQIQGGSDGWCFLKLEAGIPSGEEISIRI